MRAEPADTQKNKTGNAKRLAGKYRTRIPEHLREIDYSQVREEAMVAAMKNKYDFTD